MRVPDVTTSTIAVQILELDLASMLAPKYWTDPVSMWLHLEPYCGIFERDLVSCGGYKTVHPVLLWQVLRDAGHGMGKTFLGVGCGRVLDASPQSSASSVACLALRSLLAACPAQNRNSRNGGCYLCRYIPDPPDLPDQPLHWQNAMLCQW